MLSDSKFRGHRGAVDGGERGRRGGTIGRNRNKLTALITTRLNQTFPRSVSNRHRMAADPLFPTEAKLLTRKRLFTSIPKRWIDVEEGAEAGVALKFSSLHGGTSACGRVDRWKSFKTVRHGYRSLFLSSISLSSTSPLAVVSIHVYMFRPSLPFFPFFFSFHVTRMFAKKKKEMRNIPILNSDINIMENRKKKGGWKIWRKRGMPIFERLTVVRTSSSCIKYEKTRVTMLPFRSILFAYTCFRVYHNAAYILWTTDGNSSLGCLTVLPLGAK